LRLCIRQRGPKRDTAFRLRPVPRHPILVKAWMASSEPIILSVPVEILLEITSYYYNTPIPFERYRRASEEDDPEPFFGRFDVLRALSLTCRSFRRIFHALVWEHLEALPSAGDHTGRHISLWKKRMTGILKTPSLPRCIRYHSLISACLPSTDSQPELYWSRSTFRPRIGTCSLSLCASCNPHQTSPHCTSSTSPTDMRECLPNA
jgi:hypothetical protein